MLDTDTISSLIKQPGGNAARRLRNIGTSSVCTSIIVSAELRYGCARKDSPRLLRAVEDFLREIAILSLEAPADREYGRIRAELERAGQPIGHNDLLIAAHARTLGITVVTGNAREFGRVPGLKVENWLE